MDQCASRVNVELELRSLNADWFMLRSHANECTLDMISVDQSAFSFTFLKRDWSKARANEGMADDIGI